MASVSKDASVSKESNEFRKDVNEEVFNAYASVLSTPVKQKYETRLQENFDIKGISPGYDTYVLLKSKAKVKGTSDEDIQPGSSTDNQKQVKESNQGDSSALQLLADVATGMIQVVKCLKRHLL